MKRRFGDETGDAWRDGRKIRKKDCAFPAREVEGLDAASPKAVIRMLRDVQIFSDEDTVFALEMVDARNLTAHTYDETMAANLVEKIPAYEKFMQDWYKKITEEYILK